MLIIVTVLINIGAIAAWSFIAGQNGFKEAAKMLRGEAAFIRKVKPLSEEQSAIKEYSEDKSGSTKDTGKHPFPSLDPTNPDFGK